MTCNLRATHRTDMTDQDYLLIQCPNGHDLQAARDDLSKKLACPVCDTHFVPAETGNMGGESTPPTVVPQTISNASFQVPDYPGTTEPLRYIWLYFYLVLFALNVFSLISKSINFNLNTSDNWSFTLKRSIAT